MEYCEGEGCVIPEEGLPDFGPGPFELHPEECDGIDNDGDGLVDELAHLTCDDGLGCTSDHCVRGRCEFRPIPNFCGDVYLCTDDRCAAERDAPAVSLPDVWEDPDGCRHQTVHSRCNDNAECSMDYCLVAPAAGPGEGLASGHGPSLGCSYILQNELCANDWDGCNCNGRETCSPSASDWHQRAENLGCSEAPRNEYPCEDGADSCTFELCCETFDASCRLHRALLDGHPELRDFEGESTCEPELVFELLDLPPELAIFALPTPWRP